MARFTRLVLASLIVAIVSPYVVAEAPIASVNDTAEERLAYMQSTGRTYSVTVGASRVATFRDEPVLRFTNPVSGVVDGGLFVWQDDAKRPVAIAQFFIAPDTEKLWIHEFQSLASEAIKFEYEGRVVWSPSAAGVKFDSMPDVRPPADSPGGRLIQMRQIARRFAVKDDFEEDDIDELRLMSTPLDRYSDSKTLDGALFTFAHGTDPELLLLIEAHKTSETSSDATESTWRVALAPMTSYAIAAKLDGQDFWSVPSRQAPHPVTATFKNFVFPPEVAREAEKSLLDRILGR